MNSSIPALSPVRYFGTLILLAMERDLNGYRLPKTAE